MRRLKAVFALVLIGPSLLLAACSEEDTTGVLPQKSVEVNSVTVEVVPQQFDESMAVLSLKLDTHETPLVMDLPGEAHLYVGGQEWQTESWDGDEAGGHHREGTLRFGAAGKPAGEVRFLLDGLAEPVEITWTEREWITPSPS